MVKIVLYSSHFETLVMQSSNMSLQILILNIVKQMVKFPLFQLLYKTFHLIVHCIGSNQPIYMGSSAECDIKGLTH